MSIFADRRRLALRRQRWAASAVDSSIFCTSPVCFCRSQVCVLNIYIWNKYVWIINYVENFSIQRIISFFIFYDFFEILYLLSAIKITYLRQHLLWSSSNYYLSIISRSNRSINSLIVDCRHCNAHEYRCCLHRHHAAPHNAKRYIARIIIAIPGDRHIGKRDNKDQWWCASIVYRFRWVSAEVNSDHDRRVKLHWTWTIYYSNRI